MTKEQGDTVIEEVKATREENERVPKRTRNHERKS